MSSADSYADLYLRSVKGGGALPRAGGAFSPDIVPWGTATLPTPQTLAEAPLWDLDPGQPWVPGAANTVYIRCANGSSSELRGELHLAVGAPMLPCWPDLLTDVPVAGGKPGAPIKVSGGKAAALTSPFICTPAGPADMLAAWAVTAQHVPDPKVPRRNVQDLKAFFINYPGYVQRSVAFGIADSYRYSARYEQRDRDAEMKLELRTSSCPVGWTLSVLPAKTDAPLRISAVPLTDPNMIISAVAQVPHGYEDTLTLLIETHGTAPGPDARVDLLLSLQESGSGTELAGGALTTTSFRLGGHSWRALPPATDIAVRASTRHRSQS
jgi:hypothetical protein